jgi:energy-coupling factor transporter ATP-binding protein EcfA2
LYSPRSFDRVVLDWPTKQGKTKVLAKTLLGHPCTKKVQAYIHGQVKGHVMFGLWYALYAFSILSMWWFLKGKQSFLAKRLRGQRIVSAFSLKWHIWLRFKASDLTVESLPLIKNAETKHVLVVGTTGSGKTNLFNDVIPQIAKRHNKAIVIDTTGDMTAKYYDPDRGDVLINPFDARGRYWDILAECQEEYQFESLSSAIVPQNSSYSDPIWKNGSAKLLSVALQKAKAESMTLPHLYALLTTSTLREFGYFFEGTDAFVFADPKGEKTTLSFRSTLSNSIQFLKYMTPQKEGFSVTRWMKDEEDKRWIFLTANEDQLSTLRPLIAAVFDTAATTLLSRPESQTRRVWFILDEVPGVTENSIVSGFVSQGP